MTAGAFDRLLYTDCRAGTGRGAGGGFQVQAQSAGVDSAQSKMAVGWLLYDAPNAWIMQRRPVEDFPLGFAHACEAGYGTAQSSYLGTEATGARQGNHLADCLLTRDLDLYGPTRPAQLWRSPLWRTQAWDTKDCPQLSDPPPLGPLTVDAIADWLRAGPDRPPVLARLLSVLENPSGRRVVITADGTDTALMWIAAATLLLPVRKALEVSFKVFCSNPMRTGHRIVAVPKDLNAQVIPGRGDSAFVLDAEQGVSDDAQVSERARFWVGLLAGQDDPYDVVDAVELAGSIDAATHLGGTDAMITAWAATVPDSPLTDPAALFRWLRAADQKAQQDHGPAVARRILAADPPAAMLRWIDDAAAHGRIDIDRRTARALLLTAEIAEVRAGSTPPAERLASVPADASAHRDADSEVSSAIILGSDREVDLLLQLAWRHRTEPQLPPLTGRLSAFVAGWIDSPAADYRPASWALREQVLDLAHSELQIRLIEQGTQAIMGTLRRLWPHFANRGGDPADPLTCQIAAAAIAALPPARRPPRLHAFIERILQSPDAAAAMAGLQQALIEWRVLAAAEANMILMALPASVPVAQQVLDIIWSELDLCADRPTARMLDTLAVLRRRGLAPTAEPFATMIESDRCVLDFIEATRGARFVQDNRYARGCVATLRRAEPAIVGCRLALLLQVCLEFPLPGLGAAVLGVIAAPLPEQFIDLWKRELDLREREPGRPDAIRASAWGTCWAGDNQLPGKLTNRIASTIRGFGASLSPADRERWFAGVRRQLDAEQAELWAEISGYSPTKQPRGRRGRGKDE